jgi:outer membrane receptor protein involved in Fe transport
VDGAGGLPGDRLRFDDLTTVNFRLFANLGSMPKLVVDNPWLRGTRVTLSVNNLFNARQRVRDAEGLTPINYQPDLLNPLGRSVRVSVRKLFFSRPVRRGAD